MITGRHSYTPGEPLQAPPGGNLLDRTAQRTGPLVPPGSFYVPQNPNKAKSSRDRSLRIGPLHALRRVHVRPIYLVFSQEPSAGVAPGRRSHLAAGFPLRCIQRFSLPHVATQRCPWRDNWYTSGVSIPVLSY